MSHGRLRRASSVPACRVFPCSFLSRCMLPRSHGFSGLAQSVQGFSVPPAFSRVNLACARCPFSPNEAEQASSSLGSLRYLALARCPFSPNEAEQARPRLAHFAISLSLVVRSRQMSPSKLVLAWLTSLKKTTRFRNVFRNEGRS